MRFQPKFGLRFLLVAVALVPLMIWGVYQYRVRQQREAARERLKQIATSGSVVEEAIRSHWSFQSGDSFISLSLSTQPDPQQLLTDCRRSGTRIHRITLNDDCLVDIALAQQIAAVPNLTEITIDSGAQIEPAAYSILLAAAPEVTLSYDQFQTILSQREPATAPRHLVLYQLPVNADDLLKSLQAAVAWQPRSLLLSSPVSRRADHEALVGEGTPVRTELNRLQLANPQMLISISDLSNEEDSGAAPAYPWQNTDLKAKYERVTQTELPRKEAIELLAEIQTGEPTAWPVLHSDVFADWSNGDFGPPAEARARKLIEMAPWYPEAHFNVGLAHFQRGEYAEAIEPLARAVKRADLSFGDSFFTRDMTNLAVRFQAAAQVAAGRRAEGLRVLERHLVGHKQDKRFAAIVVTAIWIQCTSPSANSEDVKACEHNLASAAYMLNQSGLEEYREKFTFANIVIDCRQGRFDHAQAAYDPIAKNLNSKVKPRFRAEFKRLGEAIQQRKPFVTNYVLVNPYWD